MDLQLLKAADSELEQVAAIYQILGLLRREPVGNITEGRYKFLTDALRQSGKTEQLLKALDDRDEKQFETLWQQFVQSVSDPVFWHGLAVMHWEWAQEADEAERWELAIYHHSYAKYYWVHVLGQPGYWDTFVGTYYTEKKKVTDELIERVRRTLTDYYFKRCRTAFSNQDYMISRAYLGLLSDWNVKNKLSGVPSLPLMSERLDGQALEAVEREAERVFGGWMSESLAQANKILNDTTVELPRGISQNFEGALESVTPFLDIAPGSPRLFQRLLMFVVEQFTDWTYQTAIAGDYEAAGSIINRVSPAVSLLSQILSKPTANGIPTREHKILSRTMALQAQFVHDHKRQLDAAKQAGEWDPSDKQLADFQTQVQVNVHLKEAYDHLEKKHFAAAEKAVKGIGASPLPDDMQQEVNTALANIHYRWAEQHMEQTHEAASQFSADNRFDETYLQAAERHIREARDHMALASKHQPDQSVLKENLRELEQAAPHFASNLRLEAAYALIEENHDQALQLLDRIPNSFRGYDQVVQLRAACHFRRGIELAKAGDFDEATAELETALRLQPNNKVIQKQLNELRQVRHNEAQVSSFNLAQNLMEQKEYAEALRLLQGIPSSVGNYEYVKKTIAVCEFFLSIEAWNAGNRTEALERMERAAKLDPRDATIREQLKELKKMMKSSSSQKNDRHNRGIQSANTVVGILQAAQEKGEPLTAEMGEMLLEIMETAVKDTNNDPNVVALRDQIRRALRGR